ncbi:MAG TPA: hypothetical protein VFG06_07620 [Thermodesulfovibrionales bacterium]|jgi:hypothetical protein|nr:hypothetical protein [Thermodesulfovibrionales bacterium]
MLQRVHIQILDNPTEGVLFDDNTTEISGTNKILTEELSNEMNYFYPSVVYVEYVDLFMDGEEEFDDIKELLHLGALNTPVVLINGVLKVHGGIPASVIRREVDKLLSEGLIH